MSQDAEPKSDSCYGVGVIGELLALQRAHNEWLRQATPQERTAAAREQLRYIASVEEDHWLRPFFGLADTTAP